MTDGTSTSIDLYAQCAHDFYYRDTLPPPRFSFQELVKSFVSGFDDFARACRFGLPGVGHSVPGVDHPTIPVEPAPVASRALDRMREWTARTMRRMS